MHSEEVHKSEVSRSFYKEHLWNQNFTLLQHYQQPKTPSGFTILIPIIMSSFHLFPNFKNGITSDGRQLQGEFQWPLHPGIDVLVSSPPESRDLLTAINVAKVRDGTSKIRGQRSYLLLPLIEDSCHVTELHHQRSYGKVTDPSQSPMKKESRPEPNEHTWRQILLQFSFQTRRQLPLTSWTTALRQRHWLSHTWVPEPPKLRERNACSKQLNAVLICYGATDN